MDNFDTYYINVNSNVNINPNTNTNSTVTYSTYLKKEQIQETNSNIYIGNKRFH